MEAASYSRYKSTGYFPALQGIRAVSVLLVILWHLPSPDGFAWTNGYLGVNAFFVLSGFLITTLLIRERDICGGLSLRGFYVRRFFRIVPLYVVLLTAGGFAVAAFQLLGSWSEFRHYFWYYATFNSDFVYNIDQPLRHTWSLGIEEKFYVVWPLVLVGLFKVTPARRLAAGVVGLVALSMVPSDYAQLYFSLGAGCVLAFGLDLEASYRVLSRTVATLRGAAPWLMLTAVIAIQLLSASLPLSSKLHALTVAGLICVVLITPRGAIASGLATGPALWVGKRSYAIYLVHPLVIHGVALAVQAQPDHLGLTLARLFAIMAITLLIADIAYRLVERPFIQRGRALASQMGGPQLSSRRAAQQPSGNTPTEAS